MHVRRHGIHIGGRHDARHLGHLHPRDGIRAELAVQELDGHRLGVPVQLLCAGQRLRPARRKGLERAERVVVGLVVVRAYDTRGLGPAAGAGVHDHAVSRRAHERVGAPPVRQYLVATQLEEHEAAGAEHAAARCGRLDEPREAGARAVAAIAAAAVVAAPAAGLLLLQDAVPRGGRAGARSVHQLDDAAGPAEPPLVADRAARVPFRRGRLDELVLAREPEVPVVLRHVHVMYRELDAHHGAGVRLKHERLPERGARAAHRQLDVGPRVVRDGDAGPRRRGGVVVVTAVVHAPRPVGPRVRLRGARRRAPASAGAAQAARAGRAHLCHRHADPFVGRRGLEPEHAR